MNSSWTTGSNEAPSSILLVLDDLQWADELTMDWLERFARGGTGTPRKLPLLVVGTYRTEAVGQAGFEALQRLIETGCLRIALGRLDEATVGSIVADMLALPSAPKSLARYLRRRSEGNPFFVAELLNTAVAEGLLYRDVQGRWRISQDEQEQSIEAVYEALPLPQSLRDAVGQRLEGLRPDAQRLAAAGAILGREWPLRWLRRMSGLEERAFLDGLDQLLRRHILEESGEQMRFGHDQIREIAVSRLDLEQQKRLHAAAAETIENDTEDRALNLARLALHWEAADHPDRAAECFLQGARLAAERFAHAEAERLYRSCLALAETSPRLQVAPVHHELAERALAVQGRMEEALDECKRGMEAGRRARDRRAEATGLHKMAWATMECGRLQEAAALGRRALVMHRGLADLIGQAETLWILGGSTIGWVRWTKPGSCSNKPSRPSPAWEIWKARSVPGPVLGQSISSEES